MYDLLTPGLCLQQNPLPGIVSNTRIAKEKKHVFEAASQGLSGTLERCVFNNLALGVILVLGLRDLHQCTDNHIYVFGLLDIMS